MRRHHYNPVRLLGCLALLGIVTCGGIDRFTITEMSSTTIQGSVLGSLISDLGFAGFTDMDITTNEELENQGVERHQIDSVKIESIILVITDTSAGQNFDFLDELRFYVEADGLERRLIASSVNVASGLTSLGLDIEDVELADYVAAESMDIVTEAVGSPPAQDTHIDATIEIGVDVDIDGAICGG